MIEDQIKYMVERFLSWRLPENFQPDAGISFDPVGNKNTAHEYRHVPTGTNLLSAGQAEEMVRFMVEGFRPATSDNQTGWKVGTDMFGCMHVYDSGGQRFTNDHMSHTKEWPGMVRLIAAAPDLLKVLTGLQKNFGEYWPQDYQDLVAAVITKATGEKGQ